MKSERSLFSILFAIVVAMHVCSSFKISLHRCSSVLNTHRRMVFPCSRDMSTSGCNIARMGMSSQIASSTANNLHVWKKNCHTEEELENFGKLLGGYVDTGDVVLLTGDLGAGKVRLHNVLNIS